MDLSRSLPHLGEVRRLRGRRGSCRALDTRLLHAPVVVRTVDPIEAGLRPALRRERYTAHPSLAQWLALDGEEGTRGLLSRAWIEGQPLAALGPADSASSFLDLARQLLETADFLAARGGAHGRITAANIIRTAESLAGRRRWVLTDGVIELPLPATAEGDDPALSYMAPERLRGEAPTAAADLYSIGVALFRFVHGRPPLRARGTAAEFLGALESGRRARPEAPGWAGPATLDWLTRMTAAEPSERPASAEAAWADLLDASALDPTELLDPPARRARLLDGIPAGREAEAGRVLAGLVERDGRRNYSITGSIGEERRRLARAIVAASGRAFVERDGGAGSVWKGPDVEISESSRARGARIELRPLERSGVRAMARKIGLRAVGQRIRGWLERTRGAAPALERLLVGDLREARAELTETAQQALERLAVHGARIGAARLGEIDDDAIGAGLHELSRHGLIEPILEPLRFRSLELARDCANTLAARPQGRAYIAASLERLSGAAESDADADAWRIELLRAIGEDERAREEAKRLAAATLDERPAVAAALYRGMLLSLPRAAPERAELRARHADALRRADAPRLAARGYRSAARLGGDGLVRADRLSRAAAMWVRCGRLAAALHDADRALALEPDEAARARSLRARGVALARSGAPARALTDLRAAVELLRALGDDDGLATALISLALCEVDGGDPGAAIGYHEESLALCEKLGRGADGLANWIGLTTIEMRRGNFAGAVERLDAARRRCAGQDDSALRAVIHASLAKAYLEQGRLSLSLEASAAAATHAKQGGDERLLTASRAYRAEALLCAGRAEEAHAALDVEERARIDPPIRTLARLVRADAALAAELGAAAVEADLLPAVDWSVRHGDADCLPLAGLIEAEHRLRLGEHEACASALARVERLFAEGERFDQPAFRVRHLTTSARLALAGARPEEASRLAGRALTLAERIGALPRAAEAAALLADAAARSEASGAAARLEAGREALERARAAIDDDELERSFLSRAIFAPILAPAPLAASSADRRLGALYEMIRELNAEGAPEPSALLGRILERALDVVRAERGLVLLREGSSFSVAAARNVEEDTVEDVGAFSSSVVERAAGAGRSILAVDTQRDERFKNAESVSRFGIRSVLCVPLNDRGETIGAVYLDNRLHDALFDEDDLRFLEALSDHAALALRNARRHEELRRINQELKQAAAARVHFGNIVAISDAMLEVCEQIEMVAGDAAPVLISGESGTGKELVARAIHFNGPRRDGPFLSENTAAIPATLLESELFGHQRGGFTGADRDRRGLFELAHGGTLFLDEVGDMPLEMQVRLLRAIQQGEIRRVGGDRVIRVDVRIVAATHRDLDRLVAEGRFREDLLYRLRVLTVNLPPLRERPDDIPALTEHILARIGRHRGRALEIEADVVALLKSARWPGNVRQLENSLQRMSLYAVEGRIGLETVQWDPTLARLIEGPDAADAPPAENTLTGLDERGMIRGALEASGGNKAEAARMLGIGRQTLYRKLKKLGL